MIVKKGPPPPKFHGERDILQIYGETEEIYGAPRIYSELKLGDGIRIGKKRVARLMRQLGLRGADGRRGGPRTTARATRSGTPLRISSTAGTLRHPRAGAAQSLPPGSGAR